LGKLLGETSPIMSVHLSLCVVVHRDLHGRILGRNTYTVTFTSTIETSVECQGERLGCAAKISSAGRIIREVGQEARPRSVWWNGGRGPRVSEFPLFPLQVLVGSPPPS